MEKIKSKKKISLADYPDIIKSDSWKNLLFCKSGRSYLGINRWPSESAAKEGMQMALLSIGTIDQNTGFVVNAFIVINGPVVVAGNINALLFKDYSYSIQIPIKS